MEDKRLILRFKAGSTEALCRIYEKYEGVMLTVAAGLLNDVNAAQDAVHDVFVAFAQSPRAARTRRQPAELFDNLRSESRSRPASGQQASGRTLATSGVRNRRENDPVESSDP